jgi:hypothetical protein
MICGVIYALVNRVFFGLWLPVSGSIKSLGGLQFNRLLTSQMYEAWFSTDPRSIVRNILSDPYLQQLMLLMLTPFIFMLTEKRGLARVLAISYAVGLLAYFGKLIFFSSWTVWTWYSYPLTFGVTAAFFAWVEISRGTKLYQRAARPTAAAGIVLLSFIAGREVWKDHTSAWGYVQLNALAAKQVEALGGGPVAMGDRAGAFAYLYHGPVFQLEGLVADKKYFEVVKGRGDLKDILCERGVRFIIDYEVDMGEYSEHAVEVFRPQLTSYEGPKVEVSRGDQVARIYDLTIYNNSDDGKGDTYIYIWRLAGCPID